MINLTYGIYCEDIAMSYFIENLLVYFQKSLTEVNEINFLRENNFFNKFKPQKLNRNKVQSRYVDVCKQGLAVYKLDIILVGYDMDYHQDEKSFNENYDNFYKSIEQLGNKSNQIILFLPVQCIEHWLWYLKEKIRKNVVIEKRSRFEAKKTIYGKLKPRKDEVVQIIEELTREIDISQLSNRSDSFKKFLSEMKQFVKSIEENEK